MAAPSPIDTNSCMRQSFNDHHLYHVNIRGSRFTVTVTASATVADNWVCAVRNDNAAALRLGTVVVGLSIKVRLPTSACVSELATLQLCIGARCLVFQLLQAEMVPQSLRDLLMEPSCRFFSFNIVDERTILSESRHAVLLGSPIQCVRLFLPRELENASFEVIIREYLGYRRVRFGMEMLDWGGEILSNVQVLQASVEARCSFLFGRLILGMGI